jgi:hypothetical protein
VPYEDIDSDWKLDLFASFITKKIYNKSSTFITAYVILKADLIFTLREPFFLATSRFQWPILQVLASTGFTSIFLHLEFSVRWNS